MSRHIFGVLILFAVMQLPSLNHKIDETDFSIIACHWYLHWCHVIASSMTSFYSLGEDSWNKVWHDNDGTISDGSFCLLGQDDWNKVPKVHCDLYGHMMPVLASHDAVGIINTTSAFFSYRWPNWEAVILFQSFDIVNGISIMYCQWNCQ